MNDKFLFYFWQGRMTGTINEIGIIFKREEELNWFILSTYILDREA